MASNINSNNVDGTYPVAGQDNDSQGFRTNFTNIKNNLTYAKSEIEDLQAKALVKSALSGVTLDNNLAGTGLTGASVKDFREVVVDHGTTSGAVQLSHTSGHYHYISTSNDVSISFTGFTADVLCKIRLEISITSVAHTLTLPAEVTYGLVGIKNYDGVDTISFDAEDTYIFEFTSFDGGISIHISDISRNRTNVASLLEGAVAAVGYPGDIAGMVRYDSTNRKLYICIGTYDGSTHIWHRLDTVWTAI